MLMLNQSVNQLSKMLTSRNNRTELENVAIANAARATALSRFNYDTMPSLTSLNLYIAVL